MEQDSLLPGLLSPLTDEEIVAVLQAAIACGIRRSREADLFLTQVCARHLVNALRLARLAVVRLPD